MAANVPTKGTSEQLSRFELIKFVNQHLEFENRVVNVEQLSTGAAYCQMMEKLFPNSVALQRVKNNSKLQREWISNFKILEASFKKMGVVKEIPIEKLVKGRLQDNLDFLKWFKNFFDANYNKSNAPTAPAPAGGSTYRRSFGSRIAPPKSIPRKAGGDSHYVYELGFIEALMDERDFFYSKLRDIEIICREAEYNHKNNNKKLPEEIVQHILAVLYDCREGFAPPKLAASKEEKNEEDINKN